MLSKLSKDALLYFADTPLVYFGAVYILRLLFYVSYFRFHIFRLYFRFHIFGLYFPFHIFGLYFPFICYKWHPCSVYDMII